MLCPRCGKDLIVDNIRYCPLCGSRTTIPENRKLVAVGVILLVIGATLMVFCYTDNYLADMLDAFGILTPPSNIAGLIKLTEPLVLITGIIILLAAIKPGHLLAQLVSIIFVVLILAFAVPILNREPEDHKQISCMTSQRQINISIQMYAQDNHGRLPKSFTESYIDENLLTCPFTNRHFHQHGGYGLNVLKQRRENIHNPEKVILTADSVQPGMILTSLKDIAYRHNHGYIASFLDGHVQNYPAGAKQDWKWK